MSGFECTSPRFTKLLGAYELGLLSDEERIEIENHILECDACFEELYKTSLIEKAAGFCPDRPKPARRRWFIPAVSAALLVVGFSTLLYVMAKGPEIKRSINTTEYSYAITLTRPQGTIEVGKSPIRFTWESNSSSESPLYRLTIFDEEGDQVWAGTTTGRTKTVDLSEAVPLGGRKTFYWKVEGTDESGRILSTSRVSTFSIHSDRRQ